VQGAVTPDEYRVFKPVLGTESLKPIIEKSRGDSEQKMVYTTGGSETTKNVDTSRRERQSFVLDEEENPMLGFRGASRYYSDQYREGFALECRAIKRVREEIGLTNVVIMIPFCRTPEEADQVLDVLAENGLERVRNGLEVYVMCKVPSNVVLADQFAERFDGFSIGSNDLTQLVLGVDRDSAELAYLFDERNEAVKRMIRDLIEVAHQNGAKVGICGQAPSDSPEFAAFLVRAGIDSMSLNPDSVVEVKRRVAEVEA
jgi:pyruvate,water dikinase